MINLYLSQYNLLAGVPKQFNITQVGESVIVTINLQGVSIYTTTLYGNNNVTTFYGLQDIIRQNMIARGLPLASLAVYVDNGDGMDYLDGKYIIFSEVMALEDEGDLLWNRFLSSRSFYVLPRNGQLPLAFFSNNTEQQTLTAECVFKDDDGTIRVFPFTKNITHQQVPKVYYVYLYPAEIVHEVEQDEGGPVGELLSFTCHVGNRSMTVYVTDEPYEVDFIFRNSFNVLEHVYVYGITKLKASFDRKEATSEGVSSFYDMAVERKHEVETRPMGIEEAKWFNEFLGSHYVERELNQDWCPKVLISDITSEISDSAKDLIKMKFSWRYNDNSQWVSTDRDPQVFSDPYNSTFK